MFQCCKSVILSDKLGCTILGSLLISIFYNLTVVVANIWTNIGSTKKKKTVLHCEEWKNVVTLASSIVLKHASSLKFNLFGQCDHTPYSNSLLCLYRLPKGVLHYSTLHAPSHARRRVCRQSCLSQVYIRVVWLQAILSGGNGGHLE